MTDNGAFAVLFVCITVVIVLTVGTPDLLDAIMARVVACP